MAERIVKAPVFENEHCSFTPFGWMEIDSVNYPILFKVVTKEFKSLGLRRNPSIMTFKVDEWATMPENELVPTEDDHGGIWSALKLSGARKISAYMWKRYKVDTRIFITALDNPIFANDYRVKAQGVMLLQEIETSR